MGGSMPDDVVIGALFAVFAVAFLALVHFALRAIVSYRIAERSLEVRAFGLVLSRVPCDEIVSVEAMGFGTLVRKSLSPLGRLFWAARAGNGVFAARPVVVTRRRGRALVISPDEPDAFVRELLERCGPGPHAR
jgi:hypothetical protein